MCWCAILWIARQSVSMNLPRSNKDLATQNTKKNEYMFLPLYEKKIITNNIQMAFFLTSPASSQKPLNKILVF